MSFLQRAIDLAVAAHRDMEDPPGDPYILHPLRVMMRFEEPLLQAAAVLHDTIERAGLTAADFRRAGLPEKVLRSVQLLTHDKKTTYADYVVRLSKDKMARAVKIADLMDNADLRYVDFPPGKPKKGTRRVVRYALSHAFLTGRIAVKEYRRLMKNAEN
jgi:(p)ppGpp synthase/HD superfamily hydrolase